MTTPPAIPGTLQYVTTSNEALTPTVENAHLLQQSADHRSATRLLRSSGTWSIVWGAICVLAAGVIFRFGLLPMTLLGIGCVLLGIGLCAAEDGKKKITVQVTLPEKTFKGQIVAPQFQRYRAWKGDEESTDDAVLLEEDTAP